MRVAFLAYWKGAPWSRARFEQRPIIQEASSSPRLSWRRQFGSLQPQAWSFRIRVKEFFVWTHWYSNRIQLKCCCAHILPHFSMICLGNACPWCEYWLSASSNRRNHVSGTSQPSSLISPSKSQITTDCKCCMRREMDQFIQFLGRGMAVCPWNPDFQHSVYIRLLYMLTRTIRSA